MRCPECQGGGIRHAKSFFLHCARTLIASHKYYCIHCGHKWCARVRHRKNKLVAFIPVIFLLSFGVFHVIEGLANKWQESRFAMGVQATFDILKDKNLMEKIASSGGNPQEALKMMNSSERQKIQKYMKANTGSGADDIRDKLTSMGITVDESMLARIAKFKGNPKAALAELTPDEKKRIKSELDKSNIDPNSLKSQI